MGVEASIKGREGEAAGDKGRYLAREGGFVCLGGGREGERRGEDRKRRQSAVGEVPAAEEAE